MTGEKNSTQVGGFEPGEDMLEKMLRLKRYETPEVARMTRNKQNIMRQVREASRNRRKSFSDLIEINFPWFFAEPKYGVALLFVAFAALQYVGVNARHASQSNTGIYSSPTDRFAYERPAATTTNSAGYAEVPRNFRLFKDQQSRGEVKWVTNPSPDTWRN